MKRQTVQKWIKQEKEILLCDTFKRSVNIQVDTTLPLFTEITWKLFMEAHANYIKEVRANGHSLNPNLVKRKALSLYQSIYQDGAFKGWKG